MYYSSLKRKCCDPFHKQKNIFTNIELVDRAEMARKITGYNTTKRNEI